MDNNKTVHQGEIFRLLIKRAKLRVEDVAKEMDVRPSSLSRSFASEKLTSKAKRQAAQILGVEESVFDTGLAYTPPVPTFDVVQDSGHGYSILLEENERLREENKRIAEDLLRERAANEDLRKTGRCFVLCGI